MINKDEQTNPYVIMDEGKSRVKKVAAKNGLTVKNILLFFILALSIVVSVLVEFFTGQISIDILLSVEFWLEKIGINLAVVAILLLSREAFKDREKNLNGDYINLTRSIHDRYDDIIKNGKDDNFHKFIMAENCRRKLDAYRFKLSTKIIKLKDKRRSLETSKKGQKRKQRKFAKIDRKLTLISEKLNNAEKDLKYVRVKYVKITYAQIFGAEEQQRENDDDFCPHESKHVAGLLRNRVLWFMLCTILFGVIGSSFISAKEVTLGTIITACSNTACMLLGMFWGAADGQYFVRTTINNKLRLRVSFIDVFLKSDNEKTDSNG